MFRLNTALPSPLSLLGILLAISFFNCQTAQKQESQLPNIILMMGDDIGFSDIGCYGSEILTPNLDQLAAKGIRFQTFYNASKCNPTRSTLLTGLYSGDDRALNIAQLLKQAGYTTLHSGKEHFDSWVPEHCYSKNCFDRTFYFDTNTEYFVPPSGQYDKPFLIDGKVLKAEEIEAERQPIYKTDFVTDYALRFLNEANQKEDPFFLYLPYHAAHYPLQARPEDIAKYRGKYKIGWDSIRQRRFERMQKMGILNEKYRLSEPTDNINKYRGHPKGDEEKRALIPLYRPWVTLTEEEKDELDLEMAVFAAMIDRLDQNIGRVIQWLKDNNKLENTLIMYLTDNGSCPYDSNKDFDHPPGPAEGYRTLSAAWANVGNTPFKYFKQFGHAGGTNTQFIVHWPSGISTPGAITPQAGHIVDIVPTLLDIINHPYPETFNDKATIPLHGQSMLPIFMGEDRVEPDFFVSGLKDRFRMYREGPWKLVKVNSGDWELYNLQEDPSETVNLADTLQEKVAEMDNRYQQAKSKYLE